MRLIKLTACALSLALLAALVGCDKSPHKKSKTATVKLLPDTPPPPPPPPKPEEKLPEPPKEAKPQQQLNDPKPVDVPQAQALKSDEAAGDGPGNGLTSGGVQKDYKDGEIGGAPTAETAGNRMAIDSYAKAATRSLNEFLAKDKDVKRLDYKVKVHVWLDADGRLTRAELVETTGDEKTDEALKAALNRFQGLRMPLPERMPQPLRLQVANRMIG